MEELLEKAKERGYIEWASNGNNTYYSLMKGRINLELWDNGGFKLNFFPGILTLTTGKCSAFMNDGHFKKFENMIKIAGNKIDN